MEFIESNKNKTGIKYITVERDKGYFYYSVDIRRKNIRYRKRFIFNTNGLIEAVKYVNEIINAQKT